MKKCIYCKEVLPFNSFTIRSDRPTKLVEDPLKYSTICKACSSLNTKLKFFKITKTDYEKLVLKFDNSCGICGKSEKDCRNGKTKHYGLYIDHNHRDGKVRGLLCHSCNLLIGHADDNVSILEKAIMYLDSTS